MYHLLGAYYLSTYYYKRMYLTNSTVCHQTGKHAGTNAITKGNDEDVALHMGSRLVEASCFATFRLGGRTSNLEPKS